MNKFIKNIKNKDRNCYQKDNTIAPKKILPFTNNEIDIYMIIDIEIPTIHLQIKNINPTLEDMILNMMHIMMPIENIINMIVRGIILANILTCMKISIQED